MPRHALIHGRPVTFVGAEPDLSPEAFPAGDGSWGWHVQSAGVRLLGYPAGLPTYESALVAGERCAGLLLDQLAAQAGTP